MKRTRAGTQLRTPLRERRGMALVIVLLGVMLMLAAAIGSSALTANQTRSVGRYEVYKDEFAACETAVNKGYAHVFHVVSNNLPNNNLTAALPPVIPGYSIPANKFTIGQASDQFETPTTGKWAGLTVRTRRFNITANALKNSGYALGYVHPGVTINQQIAVRYVPIYMFAIFYEPLLEIAPSPPMIVNGRVHGNRNTYIQSSGGLDFLAKVTTSGSFFHGRSPLYSSAAYTANQANQEWNDGASAVTFTNGTSQVAQLNGSTWIDSRQSNWTSTATTRWNGNLQDRSHGVTPLNPPIPTGVDAHALIERAAGSDGAALQGSKFEYKASMKLIADANGNVTGYQRTSAEGVLPATYSTISDLTYPDPTGPTTKPRKSIVTSATFYDSREKKTVVTVDVDLKNMVEAFKNGRSDLIPPNGLLYVSNEDRSGPKSGAVRLINGAELPYSPLASGFSVATDDAIYIKGDYNTVTPAGGRPRPLSMVAGDALMILSNSWSDANAVPGSVKSVGNRVATATTTNAVFITGIVPSGADTDGNAATQEYNYSGGVENYFRYLETWGSSTNHTFAGSIVSLFKSTRFTGRWNNNGDIYSPPKRVWSWDANLMNNNGPPGAPYYFEFQRATWSLG